MRHNPDRPRNSAELLVGMMMFAPPTAVAGILVNFIMLCVYLTAAALMIAVLEAGSFGCESYPNTSYGDNACPQVLKYIAPRHEKKGHA
jgi:hypothetical protein